MSVFVTDTHALLWYLGGSSLLGDAARAVFDQAAEGTCELRVPAIVLADLVMLSEKRKVHTHMAEIVTKSRDTRGFDLTALTPAIALRIQSLAALGDIHDRLIVVEAPETGGSLITRDEAITASQLVPIVW